MINNLGIVDTKKIIAAIHESFGLDLKDYNLTTLKKRFSHLLFYFNAPIIDDFILDIKSNNFNKDEFIDQLMIDSTELFRDPSFWRELRENYLPDITSTVGSKIWLAGVSSGEEIYSLMILLRESGLRDKIRVEVSCPSTKRIERIRNGGFYDMKKMEVGDANYVRFAGDGDLKKHYTVEGTKAIMDTTLLNGVEFNTMNVSQENPSKGYRIIVFRNILIQYNLPLYEKVVRKLTQNITVGGHLMIGNKETLEHSEVGKRMQLVNDIEKIYRKRFD